MVDENKDEEYYYAESKDTSTSVYGGSGAAIDKDKFFDKMNRRSLILIVVGLIVVVIAMIKVVDLFMAPRKAVKHEATVTRQLPKQIVSQVTQMPSALSQKLSILEQHDRVSHAKLTSIANVVNGMETNLNSLSQSVNNMNTTLQRMNAQLQRQQKLITRLLPKKKPVKKVKKAPPPVYYINAMIPGRVWLIRAGAGDDSSLSLSPGDNLPGYGKINRIDPQQGVIHTSSGRLLRYSPQDR